MELQPPRGTDDLLPPRSDAMLRRYTEAHELGRRYGFRYVETPTFEHTDLFARTSGGTSDVVTKEMFTFEDKGGRSVTLSPEGTAPVVRGLHGSTCTPASAHGDTASAFIRDRTTPPPSRAIARGTATT